MRVQIYSLQVFVVLSTLMQYKILLRTFGFLKWKSRFLVICFDIQELLTDFHGNEAKKIFFFLKKKFKMADSKKAHFSKSPILNIFL